MAENSIFSKPINDTVWNFLKQNNLSNVSKNLQELLNCRQFFNEYREVTDGTTRWKAYIEGEGGSDYIINYNTIKEDNKTQQFIQNLIQSYKLIDVILNQLGVINKVKMVFTFIDNEGYYRIDDMQLTADMVYLNKQASSKGGEYGLRLNEAKMKEIKRQELEKQEQKKIQQALSTHFNNFIKPFLLWEKNSAKTTNWKANIGILAEAFERHLENLRQLDNPLNVEKLMQSGSQHFGSYGDRWMLYLQSSGSDAFFTGPDTENAQVKNQNASIVSNVKTIISAIDGIVGILNSENSLIKTANGQITLKDEVKTIFDQSSAPASMQRSFIEDLQRQSPEIAKKIIQQMMAQNNGKVVIKWTEGTGDNKKTRSKTIKSKQLLKNGCIDFSTIT